MSTLPAWDSMVSVEQEVHWGDCVCAPPCAVFTENTAYYVKEGNDVKGHIKENSSFICRMCIPAGARTMKSEIKIDGTEYVGVKDFRLGYACQWCCCERPEITVRKNDKVVGTVI